MAQIIQILPMPSAQPISTIIKLHPVYGDPPAPSARVPVLNLF